MRISKPESTARFTKNKPMESLELVNNSPMDEPAESRQPSLKWYPYFLVNGNIKEKISKQPFEFSDCPTREDVETAIIESRFHPPGKYKIEKRKNGQPVEYFYCEKPESSFFQQNNSKTAAEAVPEFYDDESDDAREPEFDLNAIIESRAEVLALRREVENLKRRDRDRDEAAQTSQSETISLVREIQKQSEKAYTQGREQGLEMMKMFMQFQPQQKENPTELMLSMLKGTLDVQRGVRELSDEISPDNSGSSSFLGDAAKLVTSIGQNAPVFAPILTGIFGSKSAAQPPKNNRTRTPPETAITPTATGELSDLAAKIKAKGK